MQKNQEFELTIEDLGVDGEGIGKYDGMTFFVKDALIGDVIRAKVIKLKKTYGYARMLEIIHPSKDRVEPKCPISRPCGGCQIQALSYEKQLEFKQNKVRNNLIRIGGFDAEELSQKMEPIIGMQDPYFYRNKAQFPVGYDKDGHVIAGFYAGRTHTIIPVEKCWLGVEENEIIVKKVLAFMEENNIKPYDEKTHTGLVRHILIRYGFFSKEILVCLVINGKKLPHEEKLAASLREIPGMTSIQINCNEARTNVILGDTVQTIWGQDFITDSIGGVQYQISALSFYQVNPVQTEKLYKKALEYVDLTGNETVWDLYCGIGTISLFLAQKAKQVYGVEIVPQAIFDAKKNAALNQITNVEFFVGKAEEVVPDFVEQKGQFAAVDADKMAADMRRPDVIVVDPPRKGCEETLLLTMLAMAPEKIVYVSCDSATLARDLKILCERKYRLERVCAVDQFCHTTHVET
ncbi:MAG: 23S rRNA (uracil(1939)-C(5))-methyltransferase RlmD, partial [Lachnospiraceae bacterium]